MADLDINVSSQSVAAAAVDLDRLAAAAVEAGSSIDSLAARQRNQSSAAEAQSTATQQASTAARAAAASSMALAQANDMAAAAARAAQAAALGQTEALHGMRFAVGNVAAQFQDIAVTSAMGMNALTIGLQQGTQLSAVLGMQGGGLTTVVRTLGAALGSVLSPLSLVTIGLVSASAVAIQWGISLAKGGETATEALERHQEEVAALLEGYEDIAEAVDDAFDAASKLPQGVVLSDLGASLKDQEEAAARAAEKITEYTSALEDMEGVASQLPDNFGGEEFWGPGEQEDVEAYKSLIDELNIAVDSTKGELIEAMIAARELYNEADDPAIRNAASAAYEFARGLLQAEDAMYALRLALSLLNNGDELAAVSKASATANDAIERLTKSSEGLRTERERARDDLNDALGSGDQLQKLAAEAKYKELIEGYDKRDAEREAKRGSRAQTPEDKWETQVKNYEDRLSLMALENELWDAGTLERERRLQTEELLAKATDAGLEETPELIEQIEDLADQYARLNLEAMGIETTLSNRTVWEELRDELELLDEQLAAGVISWETYQRATQGTIANTVAGTLGSLASLSSGLSSAFEDVKGLSVATAVLKGAESIASAYADGLKYFGLPGAVAYAGIAAVAAAANVATVLNTNKNSKSISSAGGSGAAEIPTAAQQGPQARTASVTLQGEYFTRDAVGSLFERLNEELGTNGLQIVTTYKQA